MRIKPTVTLLAFSLLVACSPQKEVLDGWIDSDERKLFSQLGVPDRTAEAGGIRFLSYAINSPYGGGTIRINTFNVEIASGRIVGTSCSGLCVSLQYPGPA